MRSICVCPSATSAASTSEADAVARVHSFTAEHPKSNWITGRGWNQVLWSDRQFPTKESLDKLSSGKAIVLTRIDGHATRVNSKALHLAGINDATPDPQGGQILRDKQGRATGVLIDNAMSLVSGVMPKANDAQITEYIDVALQQLAIALGGAAFADRQQA